MLGDDVGYDSGAMDGAKETARRILANPEYQTEVAPGNLPERHLSKDMTRGSGEARSEGTGSDSGRIEIVLPSSAERDRGQVLLWVLFSVAGALLVAWATRALIHRTRPPARAPLGSTRTRIPIG